MIRKVGRLLMILLTYIDSDQSVYHPCLDDVFNISTHGLCNRYLHVVKVKVECPYITGNVEKFNLSRHVSLIRKNVYNDSHDCVIYTKERTLDYMDLPPDILIAVPLYFEYVETLINQHFNSFTQ